ncbi:hypothetical protein GKZ68_15420 [Hymenobacter sp. BRD128]|uniref:hypothetical protein n=1 Tax=Hymenobacter sp. BRD128 TaxID=2675878 RepID=UPI001598C87F|nr:hypothetical protein [Hymenobacter sp. BRD128]QKG57894.1 hypothetical protein GKZ68_15420 [Hymenobacter sp. BRD128]
MLPTIPLSLAVAFGLTTLLAVALLYYAAQRSGRTLLVLAGWLLVQSALALSGFYTVTTGLPPRLAFALGPPVLLLLASLATARGRAYLADLRLEVLTLLHVVRLPVELVLYRLYVHGAVPRLMTFEGRNWDILMGLSAPLVYYLVRRQRIGRRALLGWNILGLGLLLNIVVTAVLSVPSPVQRFAFEQPNVGLLYFPFNWLPAVVVPLVLLAHVAALQHLLVAPYPPRPAAAAGRELSAWQ